MRIEDMLYGNLPMIMDGATDDNGGAGDAGGDAGGDQGGAGYDAGAGDQGGDSGAGDSGDAGVGKDVANITNVKDKGDAGDDGAGEGDADDKGDAGDNKDKDKDKAKDGEGDKAAKDKAEADAKWGEKWREDYAGDDEKKLAYLNRFTSPKALMDKLFEQDKLIRSGGHKTKIDENSSEEDIKKYREENGIPEKPEGYLDSLPEGLVLGEDAKEGAEGYLKAMHDINADPETVARGLEEFQKHQENYTNMIAQRDQEKANEAQQYFKEEWGADYEANLNSMTNFIENNFPQDVQDALMNGRLGDEDGTPLLASTAVIEAFSRIQREINPMGTVTNGQGMDTIDSIQDQIKTYEDRMGTKEWFKDEKAQQHYRELVTARERYESKQAKQ